MENLTKNQPVKAAFLPVLELIQWGLNFDGMNRVLMHVPKSAGPIPIDRSGGLGSRAISEGWGYDTDYFIGPEFLY